MGLFQKWFGKKGVAQGNGYVDEEKILPVPQPTNQPCGCQTEELTDFIGEFVKEATLQPAVQQWAQKQEQYDDGDCGCGCGSGEELGSMQKAQAGLPQLEVLLAGHKAWCEQLEQVMRDGKSSEYNMQQVGSELMCCIGQWLNCEGQALRDYVEYGHLMEVYQQFQSCVVVMLDNHQRGYFMDALQMLRGDFAVQSVRVQDALQALVNQVRAQMDR